MPFRETCLHCKKAVLHLQQCIATCMRIASTTDFHIATLTSCPSVVGLHLLLVHVLAILMLYVNLSEEQHVANCRHITAPQRLLLYWRTCSPIIGQWQTSLPTTHLVHKMNTPPRSMGKHPTRSTVPTLQRPMVASGSKRGGRDGRRRREQRGAAPAHQQAPEAQRGDVHAAQKMGEH